MVRPSDWWVLDLDRDPVPGVPSSVRSLARSWSNLADDAEWAETRVRQLLGDGAVGAWIGEAGDAFRSKTGDLPKQLGQCKDSYRLAAEALQWWADRLDLHQDDADAALVKGRVARADLEAAQAQAVAAAAAVRSAGFDPALLPTPEQVRDARARLSSAQRAASSADSAVASAQTRLDAARQLALDAASLRDGDAQRTASRIHEASDAGIPERSRWDRFKDWAGEAWDVVVTIAKVVVAVLGIVALIIGGPLAWVVFAAALLVLADTIMKYMQDRASLWDVAFSALACIPGVKGLTTLAALKTAFRSGGALGAGVHVLAAGRTALVEMAQAVRAIGPGAMTAVREFTAQGVLAVLLRFGRAADGGGDAMAAPAAVRAPNMYLDGGLDVGALHLPTEGVVGDLLAGYDRFGGQTPEAFAGTWGNGRGGYNWDLVPNDGFDGERVVMDMFPGERLDRFGPPEGRYLSPPETPYAERGLPPSNLDATQPNFGYHQYEVLERFPAEVGYIAPAMSQPGGGLQVFVNGSLIPEGAGQRVNVQWLVDKGYLKELPL
ncbi:MAG TPA: TNT domain-containing protein [Nocardioidaceae bacterium]|nr:TNT domain-containing protein [Nocardioidaceae bacterium]